LTSSASSSPAARFRRISCASGVSRCVCTCSWKSSSAVESTPRSVSSPGAVTTAVKWSCLGDPVFAIMAIMPTLGSHSAVTNASFTEACWHKEGIRRPGAVQNAGSMSVQYTDLSFCCARSDSDHFAITSSSALSCGSLCA